MSGLLAKPPEGREPGAAPADVAWTASHDRFAASVPGTDLPTFGGQARFRDAARQEPWS